MRRNGKTKRKRNCCEKYRSQLARDEHTKNILQLFTYFSSSLWQVTRFNVVNIVCLLLFRGKGILSLNVSSDLAAMFENRKYCEDSERALNRKHVPIQLVSSLAGTMEYRNVCALYAYMKIEKLSRIFMAKENVIEINWKKISLATR